MYLMTALLYYDYALTFTDELALFWRKGVISWAGVLFFTTRYSPLFFHSLIALQLYATDLTNEVRIDTEDLLFCCLKSDVARTRCDHFSRLLQLPR